MYIIRIIYYDNSINNIFTRNPEREMHISRFLMPLTAVFLTAACATVPTGGYYGDISELGTPGAVLARLGPGTG